MKLTAGLMMVMVLAILVVCGTPGIGEIKQATILDNAWTGTTAKASSQEINAAGKLERIIIDLRATSGATAYTQIMYIASGDGYKVYGPVTNTATDVTVIRPTLTAQDKTGTEITYIGSKSFDTNGLVITAETNKLYIPLMFNQLKLYSWSANSTSNTLGIYVTYDDGKN